MFNSDGMPLSYYLYPRSSVSKTNLRLANSVGIIDSGYRGNIIGMFDIINHENNFCEKYSRLLQICSPTLKPLHVEIVNNIDLLGLTERGDNGFGSTGV
jgi:dUTP pyrophosphatase